MYGKFSENYKRTAIETAGKLDLIIMCYEKSIELLNQAKNHFMENEIEKKARKIQKALNIINELRGCLDMEKGGQIARNLDSIYSYINSRLLRGDIQKDLAAFDECANILGELKGAWEAVSSPEEKNEMSIPDGQDNGMKQLAQMFA